MQATSDPANVLDDFGHKSRSVQRASLIAGVGLVLMVGFAMVGNFVAIEGLVTYGDATQTATQITNAESTFRLGIASLLMVAVLDVIVAWGLYTVFEPVSRSLSLLTAWLRIIYAGVFAVAISHLVGAVNILNDADALGVFSTEQAHILVLAEIQTFADIWSVGLILFGVHLLTLAYLIYQAAYAPKILGVLIAIAGFGYLIDSFGTILSATYSLELALLTFVGELVLIGWLLLRSRRLELQPEAAPSVK